MTPHLSQLALAGTLCLVGACSRPQPDLPPGSRVRISTRPQVSNAAHGNTAANAICAQFTLTPYSFNGAGGAVLAGSPVVFTTTSSSTYTDQILGCVDNGDGTYAPPAGAAGYAQGPFDWAYFVSATAFAYCDNTTADGGVPTHVLDQATVNPAPAFLVPVQCSASADTPLVIDYPVALSSPSPTGDIDISVGVTATTQFVGCKRADVVTLPGGGSDQELHFGESFVIDAPSAASSSPVPLGLIGFTTTATSSSSDANVAQYGDQTWAADPDGDLDTRIFNSNYAGQFTKGATLPSVIFQTFLSNADETQRFTAAENGLFSEWVDSRHAFCLTTGADTATGGASQPTTVGKLADAFFYIPAVGYAAASLASGGGSLEIYSQMAPNSADVYTHPAGATRPVVTMNGAPGFSSTAMVTSPGAGFNDGLQVATLVAPSGTTFTGVYNDLTTPGQFLVGGSATIGGVTTIVWANLSWKLAPPRRDSGPIPLSRTRLTDSSEWQMSAFSDFAFGVPPGFGVSSGGGQLPPGFHPAGSMIVRTYYAATRLLSGLVLLVGGAGNPDILASADLYDPATGLFTPTGSLHSPRFDHTVTLLPDGRVLVAGGSGQPVAELYTPGTGAFTDTGSLSEERDSPLATFLLDGRVLVTGGYGLPPEGGGPAGVLLASAELYNAATGTFTLTTGSLGTARDFATATLLPDGRVLFAGGMDAAGTGLTSAELFNPESGTFTPTGSLGSERFSHTATLLPNGLVLIAGGTRNSGGLMPKGELYDPQTGTFTTIPNPSPGYWPRRYYHTATLLPNGLVLLAGGEGTTGPTSAELYDPVTNRFTPTGSLAAGRDSHTATNLLNGRVLIAGGFNRTTAELYY